ncbi:MAG: tetratricopeptide repeat protein [Ferruginibacter sp.]
MPGTDDHKISPIEAANNAEINGNTSEAISLYKEVIKESPLNENAYSRLMILYRKNKDFKNELRIINAGIKAFENFYKPKTKGRTKIITRISNKLNKLIGLVDKKGNHTYEPEPLEKWKKRKGIVAKKVK